MRCRPYRKQLEAEARTWVLKADDLGAISVSSLSCGPGIICLLYKMGITHLHLGGPISAWNEATFPYKVHCWTGTWKCSRPSLGLYKSKSFRSVGTAKWIGDEWKFVSNLTLRRAGRTKEPYWSRTLRSWGDAQASTSAVRTWAGALDQPGPAQGPRRRGARTEGTRQLTPLLWLPLGKHSCFPDEEIHTSFP